MTNELNSQVNIESRYNYKVIYNDGEEVWGRYPDGRVTLYKDIDRKRLSEFEMWDGDQRVAYVQFAPGDQLIWRRRTEMNGNGVLEVAHLIGKKTNINGKPVKGVMVIFESDGHMEFADDFLPGHPWFYPADIHPHEGEEAF